MALGLAAAILLFAGRATAGTDEAWSFGGFADTYHAARTGGDGALLSSRTRLRGELSGYRGEAFFFASFNAVHNGLLESETGIQLRESYFQHAGGNWELTAGRQIVVWGVADGLRITDLVSPMDLTEFLARDYDDIRTPVDGIRLKYLDGSLNAELVYLPVAAFDIIPLDMANPWCPFGGEGVTKVELVDAGRPAKTLENGELGLRASLYRAGLDLGFMALRTWNKTPVYLAEYAAATGTLRLRARHQRMTVLGVNVSRPQGAWVLRGEAAAYVDNLHQVLRAGIAGTVQRTDWHLLAGVDWYPGGEWTITGQFIHNRVPDHEEGMMTPARASLATFGITKLLARNTLKLSTFAYADLTNESIFNRCYADYSLSDDLHLLLGWDLFAGDAGVYAIYDDNSELWFKAKFGF
ncbi:hypothetical protein CSB20_05135 [bacterium DOLZORAL124_64_63]|nr:MAG: hypothetical protein CSB20_05135 [bacterium DOLZORAL124_64_63]